jgi:peptide/nickel transport system permease protein
MGSYAVRRLLQAIPLVLGASVLTFLMIHVAPGDPIVALAGEDGDAKYYAMMRARFGLDRPLHEQLFIYLGRLGRGDLGFSYRHNKSAVAVIFDQLPATLLLMVPALVIAALIGIALGTLAAARRNSAVDSGVRTATLVAHGIPVFWLAQIMLLVFALNLEWFPVQGMTTARATYSGVRHALDVGHHMVLPVIALVVVYVPPILRVTRASVIENLDQQYIRAARARGLSRRQVLIRHALPNAMVPVVTVIGSQIGFMFAGAVLVETVFAWPGLGRLLLSAMLNRDYAIITAMLLMLSITIILANLVVDLLYSVLNPRIRYE